MVIILDPAMKIMMTMTHDNDDYDDGVDDDDGHD
jgi:hypothetical protein